jgi:hypothetical protein
MRLSIISVKICNVSFMLSVTYKPFMLSVLMLNVVMLNVVAPKMSIGVSFTNPLTIILQVRVTQLQRANTKTPGPIFR